MLENVLDWIWMGMKAEIKNFCQRCPQCQLTAPQKPSLTTLILLPMIGALFESIGMDRVGPLLKSA